MSIRKIAEVAGVSVSTVSRALNNYKDVSPATKEKIFRIAREFNYFPSAVARSLVLKKSNLIGLIFGDRVNSGFDVPFNRQISAVRITAGHAGYDLMVFANSNKQKATFLTLCRERGVDGLFFILHKEEKKNLAQIKELEESDIPCVTVNFQIEGDHCTYVESDNFQGAKDVVTHLLRLGHRKIAFIGGDLYGKTGRDRLAGYEQALHEFGISKDEDLIEMSLFTESVASEATHRIMDRNKGVTAFFVSGDPIAFTVIEVLKSRGLYVPTDISVAGFDDIKEAAYYTPALTTIRQQQYELGRLATEALIQMIENPEYRAKPVTLPCELIIRNSTAPPKASYM